MLIVVQACRNPKFVLEQPASLYDDMDTFPSSFHIEILTLEKNPLNEAFQMTFKVIRVSKLYVLGSAIVIL